MTGLSYIIQSVLESRRVGAATCGPTTNFITTWKTDNLGSSSSTSITIPGTGAGYNYQVDWNNDGVMDETVTSDTKTHDFDIPGTYTIQICGTFPRIYFNQSGDKDKILRVDQWGDNQWLSMDDAFAGASNLDVTATDTPNLSSATSMNSTFALTPSLVGNTSFSSWDTSTITNMSGLFRGANSFNQSIGSWNTGNVTNMASILSNASSFNQPIGNWDTSNVTNMTGAFAGAFLFNQNINSWNVSSVTSMNSMFAGASSFNQPLNNWNVGNVQDMALMFQGASSFNQPIGSWDTSSVTSMGGMFTGASYDIVDISMPSFNLVNLPMAFDQDLSSWDTSSVTNMSIMFSSDARAIYYDIFIGAGYTILDVDEPATHPFSHSLAAWDMSNVTEIDGILTGSSLSPTAYDATLLAWSSQNLQPGLTLDAEGLHYCNSSAARQNIITMHTWAINDAGASCFYLPPSSSLSAIDLTSDSEVPDVYDSTNHTVRLTLGGVPLAEASFAYNSLIDWSNVSGAIDENTFKSVIAGLDDAPGVVGTHTLYVPKATFHNGVIVCPGATNLAQVTANCPGATTFHTGTPLLSVVSINGQDYWKITGLTGTGAMGTIVNIPGAPNTGFARQANMSPHSLIAAAFLLTTILTTKYIQTLRQPR